LAARITLARPLLLVPPCSGLRFQPLAGRSRQFLRLPGSVHGLFLRIVGPWSAIFAAGGGRSLMLFTKGSDATMISMELIANIRRLFYAWDWEIGPISAPLGL